MLNREKFLQHMFEEFPTVFVNSFSREMLIGILFYAETLENESTQRKFLEGVIPEVTENELDILFK